LENINPNQDILLSVVIPIYNEESLLGELHRRMTGALSGLPKGIGYEIIYVNDGSSDRSLGILNSLREPARPMQAVRVIDLSRNFGHQKAMTAGLDFARGDLIVMIDGDLQDPPEMILEFIKIWEKGYDVVYGVRKQRDGETHLKLWSARLFYRLLFTLSEVKMSLDAGDFRLITRKVANALKEIREESRYIRGIVSWLGFKQIGILYHRDPRYGGQTKYTLSKMMRLAMDGITSFSEKPLYISSYLGLMVAGIAALFGIWVVIQSILGVSDAILGWSSIIVTILFLGGIQLCCLGILGLYLGRVHALGKKRPLYVIGELYGFETERFPISDYSDTAI
jgi:dolichol-phosphate mannosyltransferase